MRVIQNSIGVTLFIISNMYIYNECCRVKEKKKNYKNKISEANGSD